MGLFPETIKSNPSGLPQGPLSNVFFVDYNNGNDNNPGTKREQPLESIAAAIAKCSDAQGDTIFVTSPVHVEATLPIVVDVQAVSIIGLPGQVPTQQPGTWIFPISDNPIFTISAGDVKIHNFMLWGGASGPCINFGAEATAVRIGIHNCYFWTGTWGIQTGPTTNTPSHYLSITGCHFSPALSVGGINFHSNGSWNLVENCFFEQTPGPQILIDGYTTAAGRVLNCMFSLDSDTAGEAITLSNGTRWMFVGNRANDLGITAMTTVPWVDSIATNVWCDNYRCNAVVLPA
ncbi:MAG TPA: hypothetical protein VM537_29165 [Anaerolineae bacterium]|nr:hypothetical protein [Anaerolineae bacterium]